jgi:hypothetical protein
MFRQKQCHPQGATIFLSEPLPRKYGRRQVIGHMTEPTACHSTARLRYLLLTVFSFKSLCTRPLLTNGSRITLSV